MRYVSIITSLLNQMRYVPLITNLINPGEVNFEVSEASVVFSLVTGFPRKNLVFMWLMFFMVYCS